nr:hypothetical protein [Tanacetum cinerariifolium]
MLTDKVIHTMETDIVRLVVEIESFGKSFDEFDKETWSAGGFQTKQADLSCVHALNELHSHEICVVSRRSLHEKLNSFPKILSDFMMANKCIDLICYSISSITGQMSRPCSTDSRIILPCCLFIMYSTILVFQESYNSFSNIGGRLSAPDRIALSARVVIERLYVKRLLYDRTVVERNCV